MSHKDDLDNLSRQRDPEHVAYWQSRGWDKRPNDWASRRDSGDTTAKKIPKSN